MTGSRFLYYLKKDPLEKCIPYSLTVLLVVFGVDTLKVYATLSVVVTMHLSGSLYQAVWAKPKPISPLVLIKLAIQAYRSLSDPIACPEWMRLWRSNQDTTIDVFHHDANNKIVIAVSGTDPSFLGDLKEDAKLFAQKMKSYIESDAQQQNLSEYTLEVLEDMAEVERKFPKCSELYLSAHSLGAAICEAAWATDLFRKVAEREHQIQVIIQQEGCHREVAESRVKPLKLWKCITWESPGFHVSAELQNVLDTHRDEVNRCVAHYLGAPNVINCLHPHISVNRRYRVFLRTCNRLTSRHFLTCLWSDFIVVMNWMTVVRVGSAAMGGFCKTAASAAGTESGLFSEPASKFGQRCWRFCRIEKLRDFWYGPTAANELNAFAAVFENYAASIGGVQQTALDWVQHLLPHKTITGLKWSLLCGNVAAQGSKSLDYVLQQHSLINHVDAFDARSGYPLRWAHMVEWPTFAQITCKTFTSTIRDAFVPPSLVDHVNPEHMLEKSISRISGYRVQREFQADSQALRDHYSFLGEAFFEAIGAQDLSSIETACRIEYKRVGYPMPVPLYELG